MDVNQTIKKIESFFLSRRVAIGLLVLTLLPLLIAVRLENASFITTSPFFLLLPVFIFISVLLCTLNRLKGRKGKRPHKSAFTIKRKISFRADQREKDIAHYLHRKGWSRAPSKELSGNAGEAGDQAGEREMVFSKGAEGFWGSMVFHAGLLVMFIATGVTAATLFNAELLLNEGVPTPLGREGLQRTFRDPIVPLDLPSGSISLEGFEATFEDKRFPVDYRARLKVQNSSGEQFYECRINTPLILDGIQYTLDRYGFAPGFRIEDASGRLLFDGYVTLMILDKKEDFFRVPDSDIIVEVVFFPDYYMRDGQPDSRSNLPDNPAFGIKVKRVIEKKADRGKVVRMGQSVELKGLVITPTELKYWAHFGVSRDAGYPILFLAFILMSAGLLLRFMRYEKWLLVTHEKGTEEFEMSAYSRYFPALFEGEVDGLAKGF